MSSILTWSLKRLNFNDEYCDLNPGDNIVGRVPNANITLASLSISRKHCKIIVSHDESEIHIEDLGSGNGTFIDNVKLVPKVLKKLNEDATIGIGTNVDHRCPTLKIEEHYHYRLIRRKRAIDTVDLTDVLPVIKKSDSIEDIKVAADAIEIVSSDEDRDDKKLIKTVENIVKPKNTIAPIPVLENRRKNVGKRKSVDVLPNSSQPKQMTLQLGALISNTINSTSKTDFTNASNPTTIDNAQTCGNNAGPILFDILNNTPAPMSIRESLDSILETTPEPPKHGDDQKIKIQCRQIQSLLSTAPKSLLKPITIKKENLQQVEQISNKDTDIKKPNVQTLVINLKPGSIVPATSASQHTTNIPAQPTTNIPAQPTTNIPAQPTTNIPAQPTTNIPSWPTTNIPTQPIIYIMAQPSTNVPGQYTTNIPAQPTTNIPTQPTIYIMAQPTTNIPGQPTTYIPAQPTTYIPAQLTTNIPTHPIGNQSYFTKNTNTIRSNIAARRNEKNTSRKICSSICMKGIFHLEIPTGDIAVEHILLWEMCWLDSDNYRIETPPIFNKKILMETMTLHFNYYDEYKRAFTDALYLEIWNKAHNAYLEHKLKTNPVEISKVIKEYHLLHPLTNNNKGFFLNIHLTLINKKGVFPKPGSLVIISFDNWNTSDIALVKDYTTKSDIKGNFHLHVYVLIPTELYIDLYTGSKVALFVLCDIENELTLLNAIYDLNTSPLCNIIVSPKFKHFPILDYSPFSRNADHLDYMQNAALCANLASVYNFIPSLQIIDGTSGTGKSTLICRMIFEYFLGNKPSKKILICASREMGVDLLVKKFEEIRKSDFLDLKHLKILRFGKINNIQSWSHKYTLPYLKFNLTKPTEEEISKFTPVDCEIDETCNTILMDVDIIFTTPYNCSKLQKLKSRISWCIIDDASLIYEPEIICAVNLNVQHLTVVGNSTQLPMPAFIRALNNNCCKGSFFKRLWSHVSKWDQGITLPLRVQHRMHPKLNEVSNLINEISPDVNAYMSTHGNPLPAYRVLSKSILDFENSSNVDFNRNTSIYIAKMAWALYKYLDSIDVNYTITILSENSDHLAFILLYLKSINFGNKVAFSVSSISNFRGNESDVVFLCYYNNDIYDDVELLKIGVSCAKHSLYIICQLGYANINKHWKMLFADASKNKNIWNISTSLNPEKISAQSDQSILDVLFSRAPSD